MSCGRDIAFVEANHQYIEIPVQELDADGNSAGVADLTGFSASFSWRIGSRTKAKACTIQGNTLLTSFEASETLGLGGKYGQYEARVYKGGKPYTVVKGGIAIIAAVDPRLTPPEEGGDEP